MKKILIFINSMQPAGGIERVVANLANSFSEKYEVTVLVKDDVNSFYELNTNVKIDSLDTPLQLNMNMRIQRLYSLIINLFKGNISLRAYINSGDFDYIYVTSPFNALEIFLSGREHLRKLIISEHGSKFAYNKIYKILKKYLYPKSYVISVPTTMDTKAYIKEGSNAIYIPHLSTFPVVHRNNLNSKVVLNIGRLTSDKQQLLLLKIWNELEKEKMLNGWKLRIVGKGEEEVSLKKYIESNNLQNCVEILPPTKSVDTFYKEASLFAFTSKFEGFGMVLLEAMSFGIPCISFDCPSGPRDLIVHKKNGVLIQPYDVEEYKREMAILLNDKSYYLKSLGENAQLTAEEWCNEDIMNKWDKVLRREI
ncbi:glycosyltransferase family 4 protein [Paenibacillus sp. NPDC056722]|uniref:glycosyltransferase family 4 protein n=1 Tax=Paenibacillus sp. NPDC056722 TaxID=3345924 RepID=UPI0036A8C7A0